MPVVQWLKNVFESKTIAAAQSRELKEINQQLVFAKSEPLTLGVDQRNQCDRRIEKISGG